MKVFTGFETVGAASVHLALLGGLGKVLTLGTMRSLNAFECRDTFFDRTFFPLTHLVLILLPSRPHSLIDSLDQAMIV